MYSVKFNVKIIKKAVWMKFKLTCLTSLFYVKGVVIGKTVLYHIISVH